MNVELEKSWKEKLSSEFEKDYFVRLTEFVKQEYLQRKIYPASKNIFRAFDFCSFDKVKVVILGQDPYHGTGQANGLAFAVGEHTAVPPSLQNIFKEIQNDFGMSLSHKDGDLTRLAAQGVLLLNATLTVEAHKAGSHQGLGWETFTDAAITALSKKRENIVFMLWGNYAKAKGSHIDRNKHLVLEAAHPSPFSAYSGFFGCKHFSKANAYLALNRIKPIDWL